MCPDKECRPHLHVPKSRGRIPFLAILAKGALSMAAKRSALVRGWFRKADSDLADARRTTASEGPYDTACFHAQQAVEK